MLEQDPEDGTRLDIGTEFRVTWKIQNTSDSSWSTQDADVRFKEGTAMHTGPSVMDLYQSVPSDSTADITITMKAPATEGYHIAYWSIQQGDKPLCTFYIEIFSKQ